jgi:protease II
MLCRRGPWHALAAVRRAVSSLVAADIPEPALPAVPRVVQAYGEAWPDEYDWVRTRPQELERALALEGAHFARVARRSGLAALATQLRAEMDFLLPPTAHSAPEVIDGWSYSCVQDGDRPLPRYVRRRVGANGGAAGPEEVVLDANELSKVYGEDISVDQIKLSRCGGRVAFTLSEGGRDTARWALLRDLSTGRISDQPALRGILSLEWAADGATLLATVPDHLGRPAVAAAAPVDAAAGALRPLLEEPDPRFFVELQRTKDWEYIAINLCSKTSSEVWLVADGGAGAAAPGAPPPRLVQPRRPGLEYFLEHRKGQLYMLSNARGAINYALYAVSTSERDLSETAWQVVHRPPAGEALEDLDAFDAGLVLHERVNGLPQVRYLPGPWLDGKKDAPQPTTLPLPPWALSVTGGANADFNGGIVRLQLSSPVHPDLPVDWDLKKGDWVPPRTPDALPPQGLAGHSPADYECVRVWASKDDSFPPEKNDSCKVKVPVTLVRQRRDARALGPGPCLVVVYGAYGHSLPVDFLPERLPLLRRGWTVALVHARGGGELGREWHAAGRGAFKKENTAKDVLMAVDWLIEKGVTKEGLVAVEASSAGAVAAAGAMNARPGVFGAALLESPFVDVVSAMIDPDLPLTQHEYDEFGDPRDVEALAALRTLCPYQNVKKGARYPPVLITCSSNDERVPVWGPLKYAARLRAAQTGGSGGRGAPVLLLPDAHQGHLPEDRERLDVKSTHYAFLIKALEGKR